MKRFTLLLFLLPSLAWSQPASEYFKTVILCTGAGCGSGDCTYQVGDETPQLQLCDASGLAFDVTGGVVTLTSADPSIIFDSLVSGDTDFWIGVQDDAGGDDDDVFQIGKGTIPGTTALLTIDDSGFVGMGTTSPAVPLHVDAGTAAVNLRLSGFSAALQLVDLSGSPTDEGVTQEFVFAGLWRLRGLNDALTSETQVGISFDLGTGDVGVNTSSPSSTLDVDAGTGIGTIEADGSLGACLAIRDTDDAGWTCCDALNGTLSCFICTTPSTCT